MSSMQGRVDYVTASGLRLSASPLPLCPSVLHRPPSSVGMRSDVEVLIKVNSTLYAVLTGFDTSPTSSGFVSNYMTRRLAMNASYVGGLMGFGVLPWCCPRTPKRCACCGGP